MADNNSSGRVGGAIAAAAAAAAVLMLIMVTAVVVIFSDEEDCDPASGDGGSIAAAGSLVKPTKSNETTDTSGFGARWEPSTRESTGRARSAPRSTRSPTAASSNPVPRAALAIGS